MTQRLGCAEKVSLETTHSRTHCRCGRLHKTCARISSSPFCHTWGGTLETPTLMGTYYLQNEADQSKRKFMRRVLEDEKGGERRQRVCVKRPNSPYTRMKLSKNKTKFPETCDCEPDHNSFLQN